MLITSMIFIILVIYAPQLLSTIVYGIRSDYQLGTILFGSLKTLLGICALTTFNCALFLIANNTIDGVIVISAYTIMPLFLLIVSEQFLRTFVAGMNSFDLSFIGYLSPLYMCVDIFSKYADSTCLLKYHSIVMIVVLLISCVILYRNYVFRKVERANTLSTNHATYPLIMTVYLFVVLLMLSTSYDRSYVGARGLLVFLRNNVIEYIILFAIFVSAYFIYKRQLSFTVKLPVLFIAASVVTLLFAHCAKTSRGFGIADRYIKDEPKTFYTIDYWVNDENDGGLRCFVEEKLGYRSDYINLNAMIGDSDLRASLSDKSLSFMEKVRSKAIDDFYLKGSDYNEFNGHLYIKSKSTKEYEVYSYVIYDLDYEELLELSNEMYVEIYLSTDKGEYRIYHGEIITEYLYDE